MLLTSLKNGRAYEKAEVGRPVEVSDVIKAKTNVSHRALWALGTSIRMMTVSDNKAISAFTRNHGCVFAMVLL